MIKRIKFFTLPLILGLAFLAEHLDYLHVNYLYIKSHELRWTSLDYNFLPGENEAYTAGESVTNNNYEDALLAIKPDYDVLLQNDLFEIAKNRDYIDRIDPEQLSFYSGDYIVKVCLDKKDISINDSTLFKKLINVEILGQYELYDKESCDLLYQQEGKKFWIRDKIIMRGRAKEAFISNKIEEIWLAQMSNNAHQIVSYFERPFIYRDRIRTLMTLHLWASPNTIIDMNELETSSKLVLFQIDRFMRQGSETYGHINDPNYNGNSAPSEIIEIEPLDYKIDIIE